MPIPTPCQFSRAMRHVNGVYTQRFNSRHHLDGQLFRGRYKSILVNGDSYLLQLVRYIHRNPLKAGIVEDMSAYPWSVCTYYEVACKDLFTSRRGTFNEPRCVAIYLLRRLRRDSLKEIRKIFNLEKNSSVSSIIERMKTRIQNSRKIKMRIKKMEDEVRKSQE